MVERKSREELSSELEELRDKYGKHQLVFELAADAMFTGDKYGNLTDANETAVHLTGYSKAELLTKTMSALFSKEELVKSPLQYDLLKQGKTVKLERDLTKKDGSRVPIEMNSRMMPDGTLQAVIRDVSDRRKLERNLKDLLYRQEVIINASFEAVFISINGICVVQNKKAREMFGYTDEEAIGRQGTNWVSTEERGKVRQKMLSDYEGCYETIGFKKDNTTFPVEVQARIITYNGEPARVTVLRDITHRKKAENDLLTIQKLESIGTLAGGLAHDLNNILTGLFGNLSLAKALLNSKDPAHDFVVKAEDSLNRVTHITNKLLTFSKGGQPIVEQIGLAELAVDVIEFDLSGSNVIPVFNFEKPLWFANVDKGQIQQVFSNLTMNANQAMPRGGQLYVSLSNFDNSSAIIPGLNSGLYIKVEIKDEGEGIDPSKIKNIFDPYFSTKQTGRGLGLASAHSIVSQHQGLILVDSKIDHGTLFTIYLPAVKKQNITKKEKKEIEEEVVNENHKVLLVDDDHVVCSIGEQFLKTLNCSVVIANNNKQAIDKFLEARNSGQPFNIAILDLTIPGESGGVETAQQLLHIDTTVKMIVSSGYSDDPVMANYADYGFSAILAKPYTLENLRKVLNFMTDKL